MRLSAADIDKMCVNPVNRKRLRDAMAPVKDISKDVRAYGAQNADKVAQAVVESAPSGKRFVIISLPHPHKDLSPNGRPSRFAKTRAIKDAREAACYAAMNQYPHFRPMWKAVTVEVRYYSRTRMHPDEINLKAALKSAEDGICDAGIIANDRGCRWLPVVWGVDKNAPRIEILIREVTQ